MNQPLLKKVRVYQNTKLSGAKFITLDTAARKYLTNVLRLSDGCRLSVFNGDGKDYEAILHNKTQLEITAATINSNELSTYVTLAQAIAKGDKMDWLIQKSTELGVQKIMPIISKRVVVKLSQEKIKKRLLHWQKIAISAAEQCGRSVIPIISPPLTLSRFLTDNAGGFVLTQHSNQTLSDCPQKAAVNLLIGPEGGLTADEINQATAKGYQPLSLSKTVLRTETAPIAALAQLTLLWG